MRRGFTLVEVLVVTAIVAILAAILMPVIKAAMNQGKSVACTNNLKQFSVANELYLTDSGGYMPPEFFNLPFAFPIDTGRTLGDYKADLARYGMTNEQWYCPLDPIAKATSELFGERGTIQYDHRLTSYGDSGYAWELANKSPKGFVLNVATIPAPAETVILTDLNSSGEDSGHGSFRNIMFYDWHVKSYSNNSKLCAYPGEFVGCTSP